MDVLTGFARDVELCVGKGHSERVGGLKHQDPGHGLRHHNPRTKTPRSSESSTAVDITHMFSAVDSQRLFYVLILFYSHPRPLQ